MRLSIGDRLGPYGILSLLGTGGMGQVYRAKDTKLGREVAIKVLPESLAQDPDRLARFEREAKVLASLNHPNIAQIYGVDESSGTRALVMELVPGQTLKGPLPLATVLDYARQIASALDAAHEKGIVHRDLKPGNIMVTPSGVIKVLDFGLAATLRREDGETADPQNSSTWTIGLTQAGVILGTVAYMSPEQARGKTVDKRSDIWSFGVILWELVAGQQLFKGDTAQDVLAAVLTKDLDLKHVPENIRLLLHRCLMRDPQQRLRDIGDAMLLLENAPVSATPIRRLRWIAATVLLALALPLVWWAGHQGIALSNGGMFPSAQVARTSIVLPAGGSLDSESGAYPLALSPDAARLAYVAEDDGLRRLYVRELNDLEPKLISSARGVSHPFFSPDGRWVGYFAGGALQKVSSAGGAPLKICTVPGLSMGGSWGPGNRIVFALRGAGLFTVDAAGGTPKPLAGSGPAIWPEILPDGKTVLFTVGSAGGAIATILLDGGDRHIVGRLSDSRLEGPAVLGEGGLMQARFVPSGYLVYGQSPGIVRAVPFDLRTRTLSGSPVSMIDSVQQGRNGGAVYFAVSQTGLLLYSPTGDRHMLVWVDRNGTATPVSADREAFRIPRLSPDGKRIAVAINDATRRSDLWTYDSENGTKARLTTTSHNLEPVWTPDGTRITFSGGGAIEELPADGSGSREVLLPRDQTSYPNSWSPDGRNLLFHTVEVTGGRLWVLPRGGEPRPLVTGPFRESHSAFSPDGKWVAYTSNQSGRDEVYVARFPDLGGKVTVSTDGGAFPRWSHNGRELFYRQGDALVAVAVDAGRVFRAEKPHRLFTGHYSGAGRDAQFDVAPDGQRFVMVKSDDAATTGQIVVVANWFDEVRRKVPAGK